MNRRNFILGLGTAATLSGAASVTSAALQGSVEPGADFRVISAQQLDVRRNRGIETADGTNTSDTLDGYVNDSASYVDEEGDITFVDDSDVYDLDGPNATVDSGENAALNMSLATPNTNATDANRNGTFDGTPYYTSTDENGDPVGGNDILEVENLGAASAEVAVEYNYGSQAGTGGEPISAETVNQLFTFVDSNGNQISPDGTDGSNPGDGNTNSVVIDSAGLENIGFLINYSDSIEETLRNELDAGFGASGDDLDLLDTVEFGVLDN